MKLPGTGSALAQLSAVGQRALELLFPPRCLGCDTEGSYVCPECAASLPRLMPPFCHRCARSIASGNLCGQCANFALAVDGIRAPYLMEGTVQKAVHALKYRNLRAAAPTLASLIVSWMEHNPVPGDTLVPVPLHNRRLRQRGYNQSTLLAQEISRLTGMPVASEVLVRIRDTAPQVAMHGREERLRNVEGSFACSVSLAGQKLVLVDDVATTGSTLSACAIALKARGAASVWGLVLARQT